MEEVIIVTIGNRSFRTAVNGNGVQRFLPHDETTDRVVRKMEPFRKWREKNPGRFGYPSDLYGTNELFEDYYLGFVTLDELLSYNTKEGYSVRGLLSLEPFRDLEVHNPLTDN